MIPFIFIFIRAYLTLTTDIIAQYFEKINTFGHNQKKFLNSIDINKKL